jgi:MFS family permease
MKPTLELLSLPNHRSYTVLPVCVAGMLALAVAMGVGRFAFTPLLPLMARDGLLAGNAGAWLAAANYLGYLLGALWAASLPWPPARLIAASLAGIVAFTFAMGAAVSLPLWLALRFAAGVLSAVTLVSTSAWALQALAHLRRPQLAGVIYSGVGLGIALAGLFCLGAAQPGVGALSLWRELGLLAAVPAAAVIVLLRTSPNEPRNPAQTTGGSSAIPPGSAMLVLCYGLFGFGYILPATFLPAMARALVDDPQRFGLAWPLFGLAAAVSTLLAAWGSHKISRLRLWAICHGMMALGALLPIAWKSLPAVAAAALLVGGSFMVATMAGLQEVRTRAPHVATKLLARMTGAFAAGQIAGPLLTALLAALPATSAAALTIASYVAAVGLALSALYLWWQPQSSSS